MTGVVRRLSDLKAASTQEAAFKAVHASYAKGYSEGHAAGYAEGERAGATRQRRYGRFCAALWGAAITAVLLGTYYTGRG